MKLERAHESLVPFFAILTTLLVAIGAGYAAGQGESSKVFLVIGLIVAAAFFLFIRQRAWLLIPATAMLGGQVSVLPLPFSVANLGIIFAFGTYLILKAFKQVRIKPKWGFVDVWLLVMVAYMLTVYMRNPVGVEALGSDRVGGRPYVEIAIPLLGFWVLSRVVVPSGETLLVPLAMFCGNTFNLVINEIAFRFPAKVGGISRLYSGIAAAENQNNPLAAVIDAPSRKAHYGGLGGALWLYACSRWRPSSLVNPLFIGRFLIFAFAAYAVLQSGFRSAFMGMMFTYAIATYFRRGWLDVFRAGFIAVICVGVLVAGQGTLYDLPHPAQRALSFLPGNWDYMDKKEAQGSTEWRIEMWKEMLGSDKYIANKWLGDGFGYTRLQLQMMAANEGTGDQQENLMISGEVHSGPITAIRYVGYVGLVIFQVLLILVAMRSVRLIRQAKGTPFEMLTLFLGIPAIIHPFGYLFIFGSFDSDLPHVIINIGMQKLLENSLATYLPETKDEPKRAPVQPPPKFRRPPEFVRV